MNAVSRLALSTAWVALVSSCAALAPKRDSASTAEAPSASADGSSPAADAPAAPPAEGGHQIVPADLDGDGVELVGAFLAASRRDTPEMGFSACNRPMADAPALTFSVEGGQWPEGIDVELLDSDIVLSMPNDTHVCLDRGLLNPQWFNQSGTYTVYATQNKGYDPNHDTRGRQRPRLVFRSAAAARAAADKAFVEVPIDFAENPIVRVLELPPAQDIPRRMVGLDRCFHEETASPAVTFELTETSRYRLSIPGPIQLVGPDGTCIDETNGFEPVELKPGRYTVWLAHNRNTKREAPLQFALRDTERPFAFPGVHTLKAGEAIQLVDAEVPPAAPSKLYQGCGDLSLRPAFLVTFDGRARKKGAPDIDVFSVAGPRHQQVAWVGPLGKTGGLAHNKCQDTRPPENPNGTYAIFLRAEQNNVGQRALIMVGAYPKDPLTPGVVPTADTPLAEREIRFLFPFFWGRGIVYWRLGQYPKDYVDGTEALFANAPKDAFVFAASPKGGLVEGEPLLIKSYGEEQSSVIRLDGSTLKVRTTALTTTPPAEVKIAVEPRPLEPTDDIEAAIKVATSAQHTILKKADDAWRKYEACYARYRSKNDPTFGESFDLVNLRTGELTSDKWHKRAQKKCKRKRFDKQEKGWAKEVIASRNADMKAAVSAMKTRFR